MVNQKKDILVIKIVEKPILSDFLFKGNETLEELDKLSGQLAGYWSKGGRVGLYGGGEAGIESLDAGAPDITYEGNEGPKAPMKMAGMRNRTLFMEIKCIQRHL